MVPPAQHVLYTIKSIIVHINLVKMLKSVLTRWYIFLAFCFSYSIDGLNIQEDFSGEA